MGDFSFEDFNFGSGNEEYDFSGLDEIGLGTDVQELDLSSLFGGGGQDIDFSGFDNLDISSLIGTDFGQVAGDYGDSLGAELSAALQDTGNASSIFSDDGGIDVEALLNEQQRNNLIFNDDTEPGSSGGTQGSYNEAGEGDLGFYTGSSYDGGQKLIFDDDTEPGSSGGTQGSEGAAGEGDLGSYTGSSYGGGKKLVFDDDREPGSSGGSSGSTGVAGSGSLGSYKGSTYDDSGGTKTKIDDKGNVILPDGTKVTPGGTVVPPGVTPKTPVTPTKQTDKKDNNMLLMLLALMAMMNKGGGGSSTSSAVIPSLSADRKQLPYGPTSSTKARPGAGGVNYFSPTTYTQKAAGGGLMSLAEGGDVQRFAIGNLVKADIDKAYAAGDYGKVNELAQANKITAADVASTYQGFDASGLAGKGINLYQPPAANVQNLPVSPNNNASNTSFQKVGLGTFRGRPIINPADTETEINNYFTNNQNLVKNKDYKTIASDMYTSGWTPEMVAQSTGTDVKNVSDLYNQTYGAFDRATQENLVKQKYKKQFGLTDAQLGEIGFGASLFSKEDQPKNIRLNNAYGRYQDELAAAGRYDAPADAYYRTKAIFKPEGKVKPDGTSRRSGRIELVDAVTGKPVTSFGAGQKSGQIFELLDKYGVDPASFKNAFKGAVDLPNNSGYRKDDYDRLMGYKAKNLSGKTDDYLTKPLKNITRADLKHKYEKGNEDSKTNVFYLGEMKKQLRDKGLSNRESSDILSQFRNVSGLVNWAEIIKSKDPLKAVTGTLNTLQSKGLINRRFAEGGISSLAQSNQMSNLGGYSDGGRLLRGPGDGVSDSIPATIGGKQPARLAEGEFVVPARIVSELGNGSTNAGAQKLYAMMDRVQKARRKTKNVAADTKAHKYLPA